MLRNKKGRGGGLFVIVLILIIVLMVFIYPLGGGKNVKDITDKFNKLNCPEVNTNLDCDYGVNLYEDTRGCTIAECKTTNTTFINGGLSDEGNLQVFFIDVGQGDGIYIETPDEKHIVIDAGRGSAMSDWLEFNEIKVIDWAIATHPDADHIGGMDDIFENLVVKNYVETDASCPTDTCKRLDEIVDDEEGITRYIAYTDFEMTDVDLTWQFLSPNQGLVFKDKNDKSLVIKLIYDELEILFPGDCSEKCEEMLLLLDRNVSADVLKVAHHGSSSSTSAEFLTNINPAYAILSYGSTNPYGHPTKEVVDRLVARNINIVRTASAGTIELRTNGEIMEWKCELKGDCFE